MRIRTPVELFRAGIFACAWLLFLPTAVGSPQASLPSSGADPAFAEELGKSSGVLLSPQQMQEQHQQLLKAIDLVRRDTDVNLQRYTTAVDRVRRDTAVSLQRYAAAVDVKLDVLKQDFAAERERVLQTLRSSSRFALMTASIIVGFLLLEILFLGWISVRAVHRLTTRMSAWLSEHPLSPGTPAMLEANAAHLSTGNLIEETNLRLQNAIERLERRLLDLEHTASRFPAAINKPPVAPDSEAPHVQSIAKPLAPRSTKPHGVSLTLGDGESLIFLPHDRAVPHFSTSIKFLQKLRKRFQLTRAAKSH